MMEAVVEKEDREMKKVFICAGMVFSAILFLFPVQGNPADQPDPKAIFEKRCAKCHNLDRTNRTESPENWKGIIKRMKEKSFSNISDQDADEIAKYLIENRSKK